MAEAAVDRGRAMWLEERRAGLGGTDAAAILGLSPWANPLQVWLEKRGEGVPRPDSEAMYWGRALEDPIARRYMEVTGRRVWNPERVYRHKEHPMLIGTPDRLSLDDARGLEVKTASDRFAHEWGEPGTDAIPQHYVVQCLHYMSVVDVDLWDVAVLIGASDFRVYTIRRNRDLEQAITTRLTEWWTRHIVGGERPELDGSVATRDYLQRAHPFNKLDMLKSDDIADALAADLRAARAVLDEWGPRADEAANRLRAIIGDHEGVEGADWRATWKSPKASTVVDWEGYARALVAEMGKVAEYLRGKAGELGFAERESIVEMLGLADAALAEMKAQNTTERPNARRFLFRG